MSWENRGSWANNSTIGFSSSICNINLFETFIIMSIDEKKFPIDQIKHCEQQYQHPVRWTTIYEKFPSYVHDLFKFTQYAMHSIQVSD